MEPPDQQASLNQLAQLTQRATIHPDVVAAAKMLRPRYPADLSRSSAEYRELELKELENIYNAVKHGDSRLRPLKDGFAYIPDPRYADYFTSPVDNLRACVKGACGGDCDDHTAMVGALAGALGWRMGLRAWGPRGSGGYSHVYPVALWPKRPQWSNWVALDTTVPEFGAGDEPPRGEVLTAWLS